MDKQAEMIEMCKELRLPSIRQLVQQEDLFEQYSSPAEFMHFALKREMEDRYVRAKENRIRLANFPEKKLLEELDLEAMPPNATTRFPHLKELKFIQEKQNVLLIGSPGKGNYRKLLFMERHS